MQTEATYVLVTDSASDMPEDMLEEWGIPCIPLNLFMKDSPATQCTLKEPEFYQAMRNGQVACTSAANLSTFREAFVEILEQGKDILYLAFSSVLSCMYATANMVAEELAEEYPEREIMIVDTRCASLGQALLVYHAAQKWRAGMPLHELHTFVEAEKLHVIHWFTVDDLVYLKRGGRVGALSAYAATMLNIKPIMHVSDAGKLEAVSKVRGRRNAIAVIAKHFAEEAYDRRGDIFIAHADCMESAKQLKEILQQDYHAGDVLIGNVGPVIGAHAGPGTLALFYLAAKR